MNILGVVRAGASIKQFCVPQNSADVFGAGHAKGMQAVVPDGLAESVSDLPPMTI
jgi:hypothetical protein